MKPGHLATRVLAPRAENDDHAVLTGGGPQTIHPLRVRLVGGPFLLPSLQPRQLFPVESVQQDGRRLGRRLADHRLDPHDPVSHLETGQDLAAGHHLTEVGVVPGEPVRRQQREEELAASGLGARGGDPDSPGVERAQAGFVRNHEPRSTPAVPARVAALNDEVRNHAVEGEVVIEPLFGQPPHLARGDRRVLDIEPDAKGAAHRHHVQPAGFGGPRHQVPIPLPVVARLAGGGGRIHTHSTRLVDHHRPHQEIRVGGSQVDDELPLVATLRGLQSRDQSRRPGVPRPVRGPRPVELQGFVTVHRPAAFAEQIQALRPDHGIRIGRHHLRHDRQQSFDELPVQLLEPGQPHRGVGIRSHLGDEAAVRGRRQRGHRPRGRPPSPDLPIRQPGRHQLRRRLRAAGRQGNQGLAGRPWLAGQSDVLQALVGPDSGMGRGGAQGRHRQLTAPCRPQPGDERGGIVRNLQGVQHRQRLAGGGLDPPVVVDEGLQQNPVIRCGQWTDSKTRDGGGSDHRLRVPGQPAQAVRARHSVAARQRRGGRSPQTRVGVAREPGGIRLPPLVPEAPQVGDRRFQHRFVSLFSQQPSDSGKARVSTLGHRPDRGLPYQRRRVVETGQSDRQPGFAHPAGRKHRLVARPGVAVTGVLAHQPDTERVGFGGEGPRREHPGQPVGIPEQGSAEGVRETLEIQRSQQSSLELSQPASRGRWCATGFLRELRIANCELRIAN